MLIIPAVDIKEGRCVRLLQGREGSETVFSDDPSAMAARWEGEGAELLHVIDLDGAFKKGPQNVEAVKRIIERVDMPVQLGGGMRNIETISTFLDLGVGRVIIGTEAIRNPRIVEQACQAFPDKIMVGIDARNGMVQTKGWVETTDVVAVDLAKQVDEAGVGTIIYTDTSRDGMMQGVNDVEMAKICDAVNCDVVASGGVSTLEDMKRLIALDRPNLVGAIVGKALYEKTVTIRSLEPS